MRFLHCAIFILHGLALAAFCNIAQAADCKPLKIINSIKLESDNDRDRFLVPAAIDGTPVKLVLDTGGGLTQITRDAAKMLGLELEDSRIITRNVLGTSSNKKVSTHTFDLGGQRGENLKIQVWPADNFGSNPAIAGVLSTDLFLQYDIDLDFGSGRLNYFSQDHCDGRVAYWPERPIAVIPMNLKGGHIVIPVTLDGHELNAVVDTGAMRTIMSATTAQYGLELSPGSPETPQIDVSKEDSQAKYYSHAFKSLSFEGVTVTNPNITIMTDRVGSKMIPYGNVRVPKLPDLVIGMNILKLLHIYIAFGERKLYISPAGTGESVLFKTASAPAN